MWWNDIKEIKEKLFEIDIFLKSIEKSNEVNEIEALDEFHDFMRNIEKLNTMINEFKDLVSIVQSITAVNKEQQKDSEELKDIAKITNTIYESMQFFINLERNNYLKLDAIYKKIYEIDEEKPKKKGNSKKKKVNPSLLL
jgi:hypothetical protein